MAVGKNKRISKGGKRGGKRKIIEPMARKEWYDVCAPNTFQERQFSKSICNKTQGTKVAADNIRGRVYTACLADLQGGKGDKDEPYRNIQLRANEVQGRNVLTQFHGLSLTADKYRALVRKWCTTIEAVVEAKTADGYNLRLFFIAFTRKQKGQLSKNCYAKSRLINWIRSRMTKIAIRQLAKVDINGAVKAFTQDTLQDAIFKRCNPIFPLRDLMLRKVKVIKTPKFEMSKLLEAHTPIPESFEDIGQQVDEAPAAAAKEE
jgi:small subunit ribosomal protein S3Ae